MTFPAFEIVCPACGILAFEEIAKRVTHQSLAVGLAADGHLIEGIYDEAEPTDNAEVIGFRCSACHASWPNLAVLEAAMLVAQATHHLSNAYTALNEPDAVADESNAWARANPSEWKNATDVNEGYATQEINKAMALCRRACGAEEPGEYSRCTIEGLVHHPVGHSGVDDRNVVAVSSECHRGDHKTCRNEECECSCHPVTIDHDGPVHREPGMES